MNSQGERVLRYIGIQYSRINIEEDMNTYIELMWGIIIIKVYKYVLQVKRSSS